MLKIIQDEGTITRCQRLFIRRFKPFIDEKISVKIGHQGASFTAKVSWSDRLGIWMASPKSDGNRYGHLFGLGRPAPSGHVPIACEINFPAKGIDRKIGAAFARDQEGRLYVIHRGKIGGGQKGIGKTLFENRYRGVWSDIEDNGTTVTVAVVGDLHSVRFPRQVAQFVQKIMKMKEGAAIAQSSQTAMPLDAWQFSEELTGERYEDSYQDLARECDQGLIIRDLAAMLKKIGLKAGNDAYRDLFALDRGNLPIAVFQVVPDVRPKKIHEGVTRLFFSSLSLRKSCRLILAVPEPLDATLQARLTGLGIETLFYVWLDEQAVFPDLKTMMMKG